ncbi:MAG: hypothetical protein KJ844_11350 [Candidatus Edwardsbacteria bacterium]|nr:hypothetical protein [Candidatus Edwardsbacteria bacterium]
MVNGVVKEAALPAVKEDHTPTVRVEAEELNQPAAQAVLQQMQMVVQAPNMQGGIPLQMHMAVPELEVGMAAAAADTENQTTWVVVVVDQVM